MNTTIAAIATPPGRGGVGIVRISGAQTRAITETLCGKLLNARQASFSTFSRADGTKIDHGLAIFFAAPNSFTGEDVLELHAHGSPIVLDMLLQRVLELGAVMAKPGEFSERAFLNNKIDLIQAEAISQLINASTEQAALAASRSLQGEFSNKINLMVDELIKLRMYIEAALDFSDEAIDFLDDAKIGLNLNNIIDSLLDIERAATQGALLAEGLNVAIIGEPNVGKSTLLNALAGEDRAIVTPIAGTTRDTIQVQINIDGIPVALIDTAGLRDTDDIVEQAGIARSKQALSLSDLVLLVVDSAQGTASNPHMLYEGLQDKKIITVYNKIDNLNKKPEIEVDDGFTKVYISAQSGAGLDLLRKAIKDNVNTQPTANSFIARRRHLTAIALAKKHVQDGSQQLTNRVSPELLAEELRIAQQHLEEITGRFTSDDLLGKIFSEFCIGK